MRGLKIWGWVLFAGSAILFWAGVISGEFNGHGINKMSNAALMLTILSLVCLLLAITVWVIAHALREGQANS